MSDDISLILTLYTTATRRKKVVINSLTAWNWLTILTQSWLGIQWRQR